MDPVNKVLMDAKKCDRAVSLLRAPTHVNFETGCDEWTRKSHWHGGYGKLSAGRGTLIRAHRFAWALVNGPLPKGAVICHRCDNPKCCNPAHLFLGTKADNTADMYLKGRGVPPPRNIGDDHPMKAIPVAAHKGICESPASARVLAESWGVCTKTIYRIRRGELVSCRGEDHG